MLTKKFYIYFCFHWLILYSAFIGYITFILLSSQPHIISLLFLLLFFPSSFLFLSSSFFLFFYTFFISVMLLLFFFLFATYEHIMTCSKITPTALFISYGMIVDLFFGLCILSIGSLFPVNFGNRNTFSMW